MFLILFRSGTTESIFGPTRNIWGSPLLKNKENESAECEKETFPDHPDDFFIAGGSSGGSAVAVASGSCTV